ncbi:uncharacterized protein FMAN_12924 [Fusarium mangiferae]|uniref:Modin n=1 Tax=Fusarium mangiferae TaxID=192010 RepID=A0A1L7UAX9_FUSMA|nr:uncharacterized protein FMAN_12924 [Fusarium mangiferae]CVL04887.1 uncharacterized protein FMAN_12924 [Fusarium mangiferae]
MASKANAECLLNTTECMLQTVASILTEIQEQNSEYNWDPLTFIFTAIIGVIAIAFAALTAFQAFLTAGPGRTKSGAYAIGLWSRHNYRRFDRSEMRFRTVSSTPVLTVESLLEGSSESSIRSHGGSGVLRKHQEDYFPATWLALLTHLSLDYPESWKQVKLTGADFIPSEFSAVPAYGSIRFVATLALILSRGFGRLTLDRESGLPRVRHAWFHLIFRQHPLMGTIGFFEIYGKVRSEQLISRREIRRQFFQAHGQMEIPGVAPREDQDNLLIEAGQLLTFNEMGDRMLKSLSQRVYNRNASIVRKSQIQQGPLFLLIADIPDDSFLPIIFPHKKARLRERLDTLLLQSRSWGLQSLALWDLFPYPLTNVANSSLHVTDTANSWAKSTISPDIHELELNNGVYEASLLCLNENTTKDIVYNLSPETRFIVLKELKTIDSWLKQIESQVLCRKLTLSIIGDGIRQIVESVQQQAISEAAPHAKNATALSNRSGLVGKLTCFLQAVKNPGCFNCLYSAGRAYRTKPPEEVIRSTSEGLEKIWDIWRITKTPLEDDGDGSDVGAHGGEEYKCHAWKIPDETDHPLDGVLIYRAVLVTILYSLVCDSSALLSEDLGLIVPIM